MDSAYRVPGTSIRFGWDPIVGLVPGVAWKSNSLNLALLERHERPAVKPTSGDWAIVLLAVVIIGGLLALVLLSVAMIRGVGIN